MMTDEDKSLFLNAMHDVKRVKNPVQSSEQLTLAATERLTQATLKKIRARNRQTSIDMTPSQTSVIDWQNPALIEAFDSVAYQQDGVRPLEINKLKKGELAVQASLDLHGKLVEEARSAIHYFVAEAHQQKLRCIRIIHGKGYNSTERYPALKNCVNQELRKLKHVLAFCSAPNHEGGVGAVHILLKAHKKQ